MNYKVIGGFLIGVLFVTISAVIAGIPGINPGSFLEAALECFVMAGAFVSILLVGRKK